MTAPIADIATYQAERALFVDEARGAGGAMSAHVHPMPGPDGQPLATDVARFGAPIGEADRVVLVSSGLHGVEGHAGHGLQRQLVASGRLGSLPEGMAVVIIHGVNPHGWAWSRRVDHENIDVNRNFVDYAALPSNPLYPEVDAVLNPSAVDFDPADTSFLGEIMEFWSRVGDHTAMKTLNGGQYTFPSGVQYGGDHMAWSRRTLESVWDEQLVGADAAVALDIHTGLGPTGRLTVFQTADEAEPAAALGAAWYPEHLYRADRSEPDPIDHGLMGPGFDAWSIDRGHGLSTSAFVLEFGGLDVAHGVTAFRADNWLAHHGDRSSETGDQIRQLMEDHFFVRDGDWRQQVADQGEMAIYAALDGLA